MKIQAIRGMNDLLPDQSETWLQLEHLIWQLMQNYGYQHIRMPLVEQLNLFCRSVGETSDIVQKEMYDFTDKNGDRLVLRPEATAQCVRAGVEHGLFYNQTQRLWYYGPMFRHERPQKGRYRQFYQLGVEAFGFADPVIEAEQLALIYRLWQSLGLEDDIKLQLNTLGSFESRASYRATLEAYFRSHQDQLDEDSVVRLEKNPLRILDSKNPEMAELISGAPQIVDSLDEVSLAHFDKLCALLVAMDIPFEKNTKLVRGLDYYCHTVFEWVTDKLGAQGTVCGGGRYDRLVEELGGKPTPAVGFSIGIERLVSMLDDKKLPVPAQPMLAYVIASEQHYDAIACHQIEQWRSESTHCRFMLHCGGGSFKSQMKKAEKSGAEVALILRSEEVASQSVVVKYLRADMPQTTVSWEALNAHLLNLT